MRAVTITGPLGAGKTTTLIHLLLNRQMDDDVYLIVNEVGDFQVDVERIEQQCGNIPISSLTAGCLGCDNVAQFDAEIEHLTHQEGIVAIEPTGVADAREIKEVTDRHGLAWACVTVVNPVTFRRNVVEGILAAQLSVATLVAITRQDKIDAEVEGEIFAYIAKHAPLIPIVHMASGGILPFDFDTVPSIESTSTDIHDHSDHVHDQHSELYTTAAFTLNEKVSADDVKERVAICDDVVRVKGAVGGVYFDMVGGEWSTSYATDVHPYMVVIGTSVNAWVFAGLQAELPSLPDRKQLMTAGDSTLNDIREAIEYHVQRYPSARDGLGFPRLGAESDVAGWLARTDGIEWSYKAKAMDARMRFLLEAYDALHSAVENGLYANNPQRLANDRLDLGAALAWNIAAKPEEMSLDVRTQVASLRPSRLALEGLAALDTLGLHVLPNDYVGPRSPVAIEVIIEYGVQVCEVEPSHIANALRNALLLSRDDPYWHGQWQNVATRFGVR